MNARASSPGSLRGLIVLGIVIVALLGIGTVAGLMKYVRRSSSHSSAPVVSKPLDHKDLVYPGARIMLDVTSGAGKSVLRLETADDIDTVANWYLQHLKPTNKARLGSMVTMNNGKVSAIILADSGSTNITVTQTP